MKQCSVCIICLLLFDSATQSQTVCVIISPIILQNWQSGSAAHPVSWLCCLTFVGPVNGLSKVLAFDLLPQRELFFNICVGDSYSWFGAYKLLPRFQPCKVICSVISPNFHSSLLIEAVQHKRVTDFMVMFCEAVKAPMMSEDISTFLRPLFHIVVASIPSVALLWHTYPGR